ncbi:hypothetical protein L227DRAFT_657945 [Lentinus tigrinus ALCF2SS1-6]|uniref:F-box domain-containing protein n=1 Tax=Lentinus tigrinus ALCF2SS1-6 TaxID=1328759 RepID=A0A5C2RTQ0_9APHY|nr:hypothetical protein L227DRAFT_657945 [Lentinus tigrinus ALCF2SS1-6]
MAGLRKRIRAAASDVPEPADSIAVEQTVYSPAGATRRANRHALTNKRDRLLKRKTIPQQEVLRTLDLLNEAQAINTLPNELLLYVIELSHPTSDALDAANWLGRLYVCRRWYHLITSVPRFWRYIYVSSHPEWLELCLSRCVGVPADVYITGRFSLLSTIPTIEEHASTIRGITCTILRPSWVSDIARLLSVPFPSLQKIDISLSTDSPRYAVIDSTPENLTHLKTLKLRSCHVPANPAVYYSLISLDICGCPWSIDFEGLLKALSNAKSLSEVILHDCFTNWRNVPRGLAQTNPPGRAPIVLPRLCMLQLTTIPAKLASQLLAHIRVPNARRIDIQMNAPADSPAPYSLWDVLPVNLAVFSPTISLATSLYIVLFGAYDLTAETGDRSLHVQLTPSVHIVNVTRMFNGPLTAYPEAPVSKFSLATMNGVLSFTWERILRSWPTLQHIEGSLDTTFFSAVKTVSLPSEGELCCLNLASVASYRCLKMEDDTCDLILDALRARAERGARLKELKLYLPQHHVHTNPRTHEQFKAELKPLVENLDYQLSPYR